MLSRPFVRKPLFLLAEMASVLWWFGAKMAGFGAIYWRMAMDLPPSIARKASEWQKPENRTGTTNRNLSGITRNPLISLHYHGTNPPTGAEVPYPPSKSHHSATGGLHYVPHKFWAIFTIPSPKAAT